MSGQHAVDPARRSPHPPVAGIVHASDRYGLEQGGQASHVIPVPVREDQTINATDALVAKKREDGKAGGIAWTAVIPDIDGIEQEEHFAVCFGLAGEGQ